MPLALYYRRHVAYIMYSFQCNTRVDYIYRAQLVVQTAGCILKIFRREGTLGRRADIIYHKRTLGKLFLFLITHSILRATKPLECNRPFYLCWFRPQLKTPCAWNKSIPLSVLRIINYNLHSQQSSNRYLQGIKLIN